MMGLMAYCSLMPMPDQFRQYLPTLTKRWEEGGKTMCAPSSARYSFWSTYGYKHFPKIGAAAIRLLGMPATSCSSERNWSELGAMYPKSRNRLAVERTEKLIFLRGEKKVEESGTYGDNAVDVDILSDADDE
jgi:hypothetical protein